MLNVLHTYSQLAVKDDISYFSIDPTQMSHESAHVQEFFPVASNFTDGGQPIEFNILNTGPYYIDPSSMLLKLSGRVWRATGNAMVPLPLQAPEAAPVGAAAPDQVYPADNLASSIIENVELYANNKKIGGNFHYPTYAMIETLTQSYMGMRDAFWASGYSPDVPDKVFDQTDKQGAGKRYHLIKGSREWSLCTPIFNPLNQQSRLLLPGISLRYCFHQSADKYRLITLQNEAREYKLKLTRASLMCRFVKISPTASLGIENALRRGKKALMVLRNTEMVQRSLEEGRTDLLFENLCPRIVPATITLCFIPTTAFYGSYQTDPLQFSHMNMSYSEISVGDRKYQMTYDFENGNVAHAFLEFCRNLQNKHLAFTMEQYIKKHFLMHYILTPDNTVANLSPVESASVRFFAKLKEATAEKMTCLIFLTYPQILEIDSDRNISVVDV
jgi:hypothetical protein